MKKFSSYIILLFVIAFSSYYIYDNRPCNKPITYNIGNIDSGFNINREEFLKDVDKASEIWNDVYGNKLFKYDKNGLLTINLIYDNRQKATDLRTGINKKGDVAQSVKDEYQSRIKEIESLRDVYNSDVKKFNSEVNKYSREEFNERKAVLEKRRIEINRLSDQINEYVDKYNILVRDINVDVKIVNENAGEIEQGLYIPKDNLINIYEYESETNLIRVTAHELGHALGIDHNNNPKSIMYKINKENNLHLTIDDIESLKSVCSLKSLFVI